MPPIPAARRMQGSAAPAQKVAWYCPLGCKPRNVALGYAQNVHAAYLAGCRHYVEVHEPGSTFTPIDGGPVTGRASSETP